MTKKKNILICPLDWGIGHATRCVPLIRKITEEGHTVYLAAEKRSLDFLKQEFPKLPVIYFRGYEIRYQKKGMLGLKILTQIPSIIYRIVKEHKALKKIIHQYAINVVISDNRFGLWNKSVHSIYMTHQVMIKTPANFKFLNYFLHKFHLFFINKYDRCWIPDYEGNVNLSGDLAHKFSKPSNACFIGPLSRFHDTSKSLKSENKEMQITYDLMVILSGPEPQRSILHDLLLSQIRNTAYRTVMLGGQTEHFCHYAPAPNIDFFSHLDTPTFKKYLSVAEIVICRPGYSSIMDLSALGKKAIFIPTPGQTEQEYLAKYHESRKHYYSCSQKNFKLKKAISHSQYYKGFFPEYRPHMLDEEIKKLSALL